MNYRWVGLLGLSSMLALGQIGWAQENNTTELLAQAQAHWEKRADVKEARLALEGYQLAAAPATEYEPFWRLARACWWLGDHAPKAEKLVLFEQGKKAAELAIKLEPKKVEGHYWLGVCMGRTGEEQGILNSLFLVDPIAKEMEAVLSINSQYGRSQHVLGVLYRKAPGWPVSRGDMKKALEFGRLAVANSPDVVLMHLGLARTLIAMGQKEEAKQVLTAALELPGPAEEQPETAEDKREIGALLDKWK